MIVKKSVTQITKNGVITIHDYPDNTAILTLTLISRPEYLSLWFNYEELIELKQLIVNYLGEKGEQE